MNISRHKIYHNPQHWKPARLWQRLAITQLEKSWLLENGSLTARFKKNCPNLTVKIISERWELPFNYERLSLKLPLQEKAWVRSVVLMCGSKEILFARTVIPKMTNGNPWFAIKKLGTKPLGEVLFNLKNISRSEFKITKYNNRIARYSIFTKQDSPLLLTEEFR